LAVTGTPATAVTESNFASYSLASSTGVLFADSGVAGDGNATAPANSWDWSNSADISAYYDIGRLIPASSYDGTEIYFTPDASGVGKTVKGTANYIKATNKLATVADANTTANATNANYKATLHALTNVRSTDDWATGGTGKYTQADKYNVTNDDGYYVDIPVWIRTSSNAAVNLSVDGYVLPGTLNTGTGADNTESGLELYRAVRVAILDGEKVTADATTGAVACEAGDPAVAAKSGVASNIIPLKDAWDTSKNKDATTGVFSAITSVANVWDSANVSILDSINLNQTVGTQTRAAALSLTGDFSKTAANDGALAGVSALAAEQSTASDGVTKYTSATYTVYNALVPTSGTTPDAVATIAGSTTGGQYGAAKKLIIRVWLDGEDGECWNDNAGQDWAISLKFSKIETTPASTPTQP